MSWITGNQPVKKFEDYNSIVKELTGSLGDKEAKITLAKFLNANIGLTFEMISGIKLFPMQEIILKGLMSADNSMILACRGGAKSFLISVASIIESIFNPGLQTCIISANFRGSRRILEATEKMIKHKKADLLRQCFPEALKRSNDMYRWTLPNGSEMFALPLNGEGLRGVRCQRLFIDEGLNVSKEIQENILKPFLMVKQNVREEIELREVEDELISKGLLTEKDRISFPHNKFCILSSSSYEFEYLFEIFNNYVNNIMRPNQKYDKDAPTYFVIRYSYEALPEGALFDKTLIESAKANGGESTEYFKREYRALFSRSGDGYFNAQKMHDCTVPLGDYPTVQIKGEKDAKYILAIDPSYSASKASDYFAMAVYMLIPEERKIILVHTYGRAGGNLKDHYQYFSYLLTFFNIVFVVIDDSGSEFIHGYNESVIAKDKRINLKFLDVDFGSDDYLPEVSKAKIQYNITTGRILYGQKFISDQIRKMNEHLQNQIDCKKVWFASPLAANDIELNKTRDLELPLQLKNQYDSQYSLVDFIEEQDSWITATKNQTALIEVRATTLGTMQFDLPQNLRRETGQNRVRKDHYTCLMLACWGARCYFDLLYTEVEKPQATFEPLGYS